MLLSRQSITRVDFGKMLGILKCPLAAKKLPQ